MMQALKLQGGPNSRYMLKEITGLTQPVGPQRVLELLEEHHEEGWVVCAVAASVDPAVKSMFCGMLHIIYRRRNPDD